MPAVVGCTVVGWTLRRSNVTRVTSLFFIDERGHYFGIYTRVRVFFLLLVFHQELKIHSLQNSNLG